MSDETPPETPPGRSHPAELGSLLRPRRGKAQVVVAVLCMMLGFGVATQMRSNGRSTKFATARQDELVGVLGGLSQRSDRLRADIRDLKKTKRDLERDTRGNTALTEARERATTYGLLAGTLPATGPGIELTIHDPENRLPADELLDTVQELRDAGAEVIQVDDVRVVVDTYFLDAPGGGIIVDGRHLTRPYRVLAIGDPHTMATALNIPGGVMKTLHNSGANGAVIRRNKITIDAVRSRLGWERVPGVFSMYCAEDSVANEFHRHRTEGTPRP